MFGDIALVLLVIVTAYLLGSIPSAYIVARLLKGLDIREAGDGRLGATATYHRVGLGGGIVVGLMDLGKGVAAVLLAQKLGLPLPVVLLAGLSAVVGHNWSIFLHFQGGKGALTTYGVLISLMYGQFFIALALAGVPYLITRRTGMSTGFLFGFLALLNLLTIPDNRILLGTFPILISLPMVLKHISMSKVGDAVMANAENLGNREG